VLQVKKRAREKSISKMGVNDQQPKKKKEGGYEGLNHVDCTEKKAPRHFLPFLNLKKKEAEENQKRGAGPTIRGRARRNETFRTSRGSRKQKEGEFWWCSLKRYWQLPERAEPLKGRGSR